MDVLRTSLIVAVLSLCAVGLAAGATPGEADDLRVVAVDPVTGALSLTYTPACDAAGHHLEYGPLSAVSTYGYTGQLCGLGDSGTVSGFDPGAGSFFFLVVGNDDQGLEGSYGTALVGGQMVERPPDALDPSCAFEQTLALRCDGPKIPMLEITAYRPQSESYGGPFQRTAVPDDEESSPGVGVRINGDDDNGNGTPDGAEGAVANENDLIEVRLQAVPPIAPAGVEYRLRRDNGGVELWSDATKQTPLFGLADEVVVDLERGATLWVERVGPGSSALELAAVETVGGTVAVEDSVTLVAFEGIVIALGGEDQVPADPPLEPDNHGTFVVALDLYHRGYDVHMYDEDVVSASGAGAAYDEVVSAVQERGVGHVAIFGYSHGGGSTNDLARLLDANRGGIGTFVIEFTAYVDGIDNDSDFDIGTENQLPPSAYHANYYQSPGCGFFALCGGPLAGADFDLNVNTTPWGAGLGHFTVDDADEVTAGIRDQLLPRLPR